MTPSTEDLLRARLHEVDDLQPPDDGFELRLLRAGRDRLKRRQAWTRGLVGAAAAVTVGALALPTLTHLRGSGSATSSAGSAGSAVSKAAVPQGADAPAPQASTPTSYSPAQCQATLARVAADRDTLTRQGYAVGSLTCGPDGRVELPVTNLVTAEQLKVLGLRYGDPVRVVQAVPTPGSTSTP